MPQHKPWDTPATLLSQHTPPPEGCLLVPSQEISSGSTGCCDAFSKPCLSKQPHSLQSNGLRLELAEDQFSALMKARSLLRRHSCVVLNLWVVAESCWKTYFSSLKRVMLRGFTTFCSMPFWYTQAPILPPSRRNEEVSFSDGGNR